MNQNERCKCKKLERLVYGDRPDQSDGIASIVLGMSKSIHGTPDEPGGLIKRVELAEKRLARHDKIISIGIGVGIAAKLIWEAFTHFHK